MAQRMPGVRPLMGREVERKFLVVGEGWREGTSGIRIRQGYLSTVKERTVRVRTAGDRGSLTVKGVSIGATRAEFEYEIPFADAAAMLEDLCERPLVSKTRFRFEYAGSTWEIDEFHDENRGLVIAEVELPSETTPVVPPPWLGAEVTGDPRYYNSNLVAHPYERW